MRDIDRHANQYVKWLVDKVGGDNGCSFLMLKLFDIHFYAYDEDDSNRIADALIYRDVYINNLVESGPNFESETEWARVTPCSLLEVLVSLAVKLEEDILYVPGPDHTAKWFWMFLENLGLDDLSDTYWSAEAEEAISYAAEKFMSHDYKPNGSGGNIFVIPEDECKKDLRDLNLWLQAWEYTSYDVPF